MIIFWLLITAVIAYLIGSVSTAILVGKAVSGDDIRERGSGNAGATNALRVYGKAAAAAVTLGDCLKSAAACGAALLLARFTSLGWENHSPAIYAAGIGAALGHNFPVYFKFKGGKGVLVSITALMFADWKIALAALVIAIAIMAVTRYVSLGSVLGAIIVIILALIFKTDDKAYICFAVIMAALTIIRHRTNIVRLLKGTESKLGSKK